MYLDYLLLVCAGAGVMMIAGGIWLIYREKILLDSVTKVPLYVELPFFGKMRTNAPSLALFVLGLVALVYPIRVGSARTPTLTVRQKITSTSYPVEVYGVVVSTHIPSPGGFDLPLPVLPKEYDPRLVYQAGTFTNFETIHPADQRGGIIQLDDRNIQPPKPQAPATETDASAKPSGFK